MSQRNTYIRAGSMISSLGFSMEAHHAAFLENKSGISAQTYPFGNYHVSAIDEDLFSKNRKKWNVPQAFSKAEGLAAVAIHDAMSATELNGQTKNTALFIASTKGNIDQIGLNRSNNGVHLHLSSQRLGEYFGFVRQPVLVCNACTSGLMAVIMASRLIKAGVLEHAVVCGVDVLSEFTLRGFSCLHAMSDVACKPFDANRNGVNLGEGCGTIILSADRSDAKLKLLGGASSNDANHISGPSRTGAGLQQAVRLAMQASDHPQIDYINAHGTATQYNDEMEAQAFHGLGLAQVPLHSMKGYWGHTLGAAGLLEVLGATLCMQNDVIYKSVGYEENGLTLPLNIMNENQQTKINHCLKTSSGFGGSNSAVIIKSLN